MHPCTPLGHTNCRKGTVNLLAKKKAGTVPDILARGTGISVNLLSLYMFALATSTVVFKVPRTYYLRPKFSFSLRHTCLSKW